MPRKMYNSYGSKEKHMDAGVSYAGAPQGYYSDAGKPMGSYGKPDNGYVSHADAGRMKKRMDYMASYYSSADKGGGGSPAAQVAGGVNNSTNAGTSPSPSSMDSTYSAGEATIGKPKGRKKYS